MNNFFNYANLKQIHVELTNACNAACPYCPRFHSNSPLVRPDLQISQITLEKFKQYFDYELVQQLETFMFCGVAGDPGMAKDLYEICDYVLSCNKHISILIHTNGGMRKPEFWSKLGSLFTKTNCRVTFSVDGLEDTNHIYRRQVVWSSLLANMKAYLAAGGTANWDYLIFKHNEHQIDQAKGLADQMGFMNFNLKKAVGFEWENKLKTLPAINREGKLDYHIFPPTNKDYRNSDISSEEVLEISQEFDLVEYNNWKSKKDPHYNFVGAVEEAYSRLEQQYSDSLDRKNVNCKSKVGDRVEVFVDSNGILMPCCYVGTAINSTIFDPAVLQLHHELSKHNLNHFNLDNYSIKEILESYHLDSVFTKSWGKPSCQHGKLAYCVNTCGQNSQIDRIFELKKHA